MPTPFKNLEQELKNLTPRDSSAELEARIGAQIENRNLKIENPPAFADRLLLSTLTTALAASLLIALLLLTDNPSASTAPLARTPQSFTIADTPRLLAQLTSPDPPPSHLAPSTIPN